VASGKGGLRVRRRGTLYQLPQGTSRQRPAFHGAAKNLQRNCTAGGWMQ
jgi:hypothetical protein